LYLIRVTRDNELYRADLATSGTSILVGLPTVEDRVDILLTIYGNRICKGAVDGATARFLEAIARDKRCEGFSGADLANLVDTAALAFIERKLENPALSESTITARDWDKALREVRPSVKADVQALMVDQIIESNE
jgi:ribosome biogenesis ATPase